MICDVCRWEDDPVQFDDRDFEGGANGPSLNQAREFFRWLSVSDPKKVPLKPERLPY